MSLFVSSSRTKYLFSYFTPLTQVTNNFCIGTFLVRCSLSERMRGKLPSRLPLWSPLTLPLRSIGPILERCILSRISSQILQQVFSFAFSYSLRLRPWCRTALCGAREFHLFGDCADSYFLLFSISITLSLISSSTISEGSTSRYPLASHVPRRNFRAYYSMKLCTKKPP